MLKVQNPYATAVDPFFEAAGIPGRTFGLHTRIYEGEFDGRRVKVTVSPRQRTTYAGEIHHRRYVGHQFSFSLGVSCATRLVVANRTAANSFSRRINRWFGLTQIELNEPSMDYLEAWAIEPEWARRWLAEPGVLKNLAVLVPPDQTLQAVSFGPVGEIGFNSKRAIQNVTRADLVGWMNALFVLAQAADAAPQPQRRIQPSKLEMVVRDRPWLAAIVVLGALMALVLVITLVLSAVAIFLATRFS